jgi:4-amino-4-deoxy-L-arabinose transferase-like glycosyltransferase
MISSNAAPRGGSPLPLLLLALTAGALLVRVTAIAQPLGIDQSLWASAVRGMARGQLLYQDVWEQRPPGIYWTYLAGFRLFGWTGATVAWLDWLAATATTVLLYATVRRLSTGLTAALAALLYAAFTMPAWLYRHGGFLERSVSETFIVVCVCAAALCAIGLRNSGSLPAAAALGLFSGAAVIFKPNAGLYFPALLAWAMVFGRTGERTWGWWAPRVAAAGLAAAVFPLIAMVWLWRLDLLHEARVAVIDFNRYYVGEGFDAGAYAVTLAKAVWLRIKTEPLWTAGVAGGAAAVWEGLRTRRVPPVAGLALALAAAALVVIVVNGARLFNSYFINAHVPLAIAAAWLLGEYLRGTRTRRVLAIVLVVIMAGLLVQRSYLARVLGRAQTDLAMLRGAMDETAYLDQYGGYGNQRGYSALANKELADYVRRRTSLDDRIFLFGINGAGVYFLSDRMTAHRFLRVNFFVDTTFPDPRFRLDAVLRDLKASRPVYLIFERLHSASDMGRAADALPDHPDVRRLLESYELETRIEDFELHRLREAPE